MNDDDLRRRFGELRKEDAKRAPPFAKLIAERPRRVRVLFAAVPVLAAAAVFIVWCGTATTMRSSAPAAVAAASVAPVVRPAPVAAASALTRSEYRALPLDFLLETAPARVRLDADALEGLRP